MGTSNIDKKKIIDEFYKIVAKDEKSARTDKVCKACKGEIKKVRKSRNALERSIVENPSSMDQKPIDSPPVPPPKIQIPEEPASSKLSEESTEQMRKQKYTHPNYEDWEVRQAIEVFQILQKKRDEARKKGLINW